MFSLTRSRFTLPAQLVFLASNTVGVFLGVVYNNNTPDLYPGNAHHKIGWTATWVICAQVLVSVVGYIAGAFRSDESSRETRYLLPIPSPEAELPLYSGYHDDSPCRTSDDTGRGTEPNSPSLQSDSVSTLDGMGSPPQHPSKEYEDDQDLEELSLSSPAPQGTLARHGSKLATSRVWTGRIIISDSISRSSQSGYSSGLQFEWPSLESSSWYLPDTFFNARS